MVTTVKLLTLTTSLFCIYLFSSAVNAAATTNKKDDTVRSEVDFNFDWRFSLTDNEQYKLPSFNDKHWQSLRLPHDWSIKQAFSESYDGATGYLPGGIGWYRKTFEVTNLEQRHYLYFDGIYGHATIYINGEEIAQNRNGYTPFYFNINDYLDTNFSKQTIAIKVDHSRYIDSRWYTGSGIYRNVKLVSTDDVHIPIWGTYVTSKVKFNKATPPTAIVNANTTVTNTKSKEVTLTLVSKVIDNNNKVVASKNKNIIIAANSEQTVSSSLSISSAKLWSLENPNLYSFQSEIFIANEKVDHIDTTFGIRDLEFNPNKGFFLNGKKTLIKGVNLHHDAGLVGTAVPIDVWRRRLETLKEAGINSIRTAHNPVAQEFLDLCDEMGFLVQAEIFDEWDNPKDKRLNQWERHDDYISRGYSDYFQQDAEFDLKNSVKRDRNHPSIFMWSIGNEIEWTYPRYKDATGYFDMNASGNYFYNPPFISKEEIKQRFESSPEGQYVLAKTAKKLSNWVKQLDTTRPVTANLILPSVSHLSGYTDALDGIGYSYRRVIYDYGKQNYPGKMLYGSENVPQWHEWQAVIERDFIAGTFLWTGIDYLGEAHKQWPNKGFTGGLLDLAGFKKPAFHMFKSLWNKQPHVYISSQGEDASLYTVDDKNNVVEKKPDGWQQRVWLWQDVNEHWNYRKEENVIVEVLSNCERVELLLNEQSLGVQSLSANPDNIMKWHVPFQAGTLRARGLDDCHSSDTINTAQKPAKIVLTASKDILKHDGYSIAHITVQVTDIIGTLVKHIDSNIEIKLSSNLEFIGADNGLSAKMKSYSDKLLTTHNGKALIIVRALDSKPSFVEVSGDNIAKQKIWFNQ